MDHLDRLFAEFVRERTYLRNVSAKTQVWYATAWRAFRRECPRADTLTRPVLQTFVLGLRERGVRPVSVNTYLKALNAFGRWLHAEGHLRERVGLPPLKTSRRLVPTLDHASLRVLLGVRPRGFRQWRVCTVVATIIDTGCRIDELLDADAEDLDNLLLTRQGQGGQGAESALLLRAPQGAVPLPAATGTDGDPSALLVPSSLRREVEPTQHASVQGGDVVRLSRIPGHAHLTTTMRYVHLLTEDLQRPHQSLSIFNRLR